MSETFYGYNISEQHKCFLWGPIKTGTMHSEFIFTHYDFHYEESNYGRTLTKNYQDFPKHNHDCMLFEGHEEYKLILTVRNPYRRILSEYYHEMSFRKQPIESLVSPNNFEDFVNTRYPISPSQFNNGFLLSVRMPDYSLRSENLYEDYLKIPFIKESKLYSSGILKDLCNKKIHERKIKLSSEGYFNQRIADLIYYNMVNYFESFNYHKDSWKEIT